MKSEAQIKEMLHEVLNDRLTLAQTGTNIVAKMPGLHTPREQRFMNGNATEAEMTAIDLQIALLTYILQ